MGAQGDKVILVIPREQKAVARIAHMTGLAQIFELHATKDAALADLFGESTVAMIREMIAALDAKVQVGSSALNTAASCSTPRPRPNRRGLCLEAFLTKPRDAD